MRRRHHRGPPIRSAHRPCPFRKMMGSAQRQGGLLMYDAVYQNSTLPTTTRLRASRLHYSTATAWQHGLFVDRQPWIYASRVSQDVRALAASGSCALTSSPGSFTPCAPASQRRDSGDGRGVGPVVLSLSLSLSIAHRLLQLSCTLIYLGWLDRRSVRGELASVASVVVLRRTLREARVGDPNIGTDTWLRMRSTATHLLRSPVV